MSRRSTLSERTVYEPICESGKSEEAFARKIYVAAYVLVVGNFRNDSVPR